MTAAPSAFEPDPAALLAAAVEQWRRDKDPAAIDRLGQALHLDPALPGAQAQFVHVLQDAFLVGQGWRFDGRDDVFIDVYLRILEARGRIAFSCLMRDWTPLTATGSLKAALAQAEGICVAFVRGAKGGDAARPALFLLGMIALELGRIEQGAQTLFLLANSCADPALRRRIGRALAHYKQADAALALFRPLATDGDGVHDLGRALFCAEDGAGAAAALRRAAALEPGRASLWLDLGHVLHLSGDAAAALTAFGRARTLAPDRAWNDVGVACALAALGRDAEASAAFRRALARAPDLLEANIGAASLLPPAAQPALATALFAKAVNLKVGLAVSPVPRAPGMFEAMRGYCDARRLHLTALAASPVPAAADAETGDWREDEVRMGRLTPLADIPDDGAYHPRDPGGRIGARRLAAAEVWPLAPPLNLRDDPLARSRFFDSAIFAWLARTHERFAWRAAAPFPAAAGCDGVFMARIDGCRVFNGFVFSADGDFHEESAKFDELLVFGRSVDGGFGVRDEADGRLRLRRPAVAAGRIGTPCRLLDGYHMFHYGAWLLNLTPKLLLMEADPETRALPLVLPRKIYDGKRFVRETLAALGIGPDRLILIGDGWWEFDRVYCAAAATHILSPGLALAARRALRAAFAIPERPQGDKVFYVSRRDAQVRRVLNEDALVGFLERRGVEVVANADLDLGDIARRFADARCVLGVNGAGMVNTLFSPPGTTVVELGSDAMTEPLYWMLSELLGHRHYVRMEPALNKAGDFMVSLDRLGALLDAIQAN